MEATVLGRDVSGMFYKTDQWKKYCGNINQPSGWDNYVRDIPKDVQNIWYPHQSKDGKTDYLQKMDYMRKGTVARDNQWISNYLAANTEKNRVIVAYGRVYDVSTYDSPTNTNNFLGEEFGNVIRRLGPTGKDATDFLENIRSKMSSQRFNGYLRCMDAMFFTGVMDTRNSIQCLVSNYIMLASTSILVAVIGFKFLAALQTISASKTPTEFKRNTIIQVTCYTEGVESLQKTINSISDSKFDDQHRLLLVICDGLIIGSGNTKSTPEIVLELLGVDLSKVMPETKMFQSLGEGRKQLNYAQIYSGFFDNHGRQVPYLVVVKVGAPTEDSKPGNR
jgi:chitin synthase